MPVGALIFVVAALTFMIPLAVIAIVWPAPLARWNGAAQRTRLFGVARPVRARSSVASSPWFVRAWGIAAFSIGALIAVSVASSVGTHGIESTRPELSPVLTVGFLVIGTAQAVFGTVLIVRSRHVHEALRRKLADDGADLRRGMIVAWGCVALVMSTAVFTVVLMSV